LHPELTLCAAQGLEHTRAKGLCPQSVQSFYTNLEKLYAIHHYSPSRIWNCDESGAQAGRNSGGLVLARTGSKSFHTITPDEREWLSVLACINAAGDTIPNFYIFKEKRMRHNYIEKCEVGATMAMQKKAWMTSFIFSRWVSHFLTAVNKRGGISSTHRHLLIMDGPQQPCHHGCCGTS
jgi:hypothetical protein